MKADAMESLTFRWENGSSTPRLHAPRWLPASEEEAIKHYLERHYEELSRLANGTAITIRERSYRLSVVNRDTRGPNLVLEPLRKEAGGLASTPIAGWAQGWLSRLEILLTGPVDPLQPGAAGRHALAFVVQELHARATTQPDLLALHLLAAFLLLEVPASQERDRPRAGQYELALADLEQRCEQHDNPTTPLPLKGKLGDPTARKTVPSPGAWFRWLGRAFHK